MSRRQEGQILPIFALTAILIVGVIALAVDYGFLADQHRNLQAAADAAAEAGARQLTVAPTDTERTAARDAAFVYLRDNLFSGSGVTIGNSGCDLTNDVTNCAVSTTGFTISIATPGSPAAVMALQQSWTITVSITETVSQSLAGALGGFSPAQASASATAMYNHSAHFPYAGYTQECVTTGTHLELIGGDIGINAGPQSGCTPAATICAEQAPGGGGNITFGQNTQDPVVLLPNSSPAQCTTGAANEVLATGKIAHGTVIPPPGLAPPPAVTGSTAFAPPDACFASLTCNNVGAATAACLNGSTGSPTNQKCFQPGTYAQLGPVANNLNPGVYYIAGPNIQTSNDNCYNAGSTTPCKGIWFTSNTINANWQDVHHQCWKLPNNPDSWTYNTTGCPSSAGAGAVDGFVFDPTTPIDPMCTSYAGITAPPPGVTVTPSPTGGSLATGTYYVRVTAVNPIGETDAPNSKEFTVSVVSLGSTGSIVVAGAPGAGVSSYQVYGPSTSSGHEFRYKSTTEGGGVLTTLTPSVTLQTVAVDHPTVDASGGMSPPASLGLSATNGGNLNGGQTYWVMVSAKNATGETTFTENSVAIPGGGSTNRAIQLTIPTVAGATSYSVYGPSTTAGAETFLESIPQPATPLPATLTLSPPQSPITDVNPRVSGYPTTNTTGNATIADPTFTLASTTDAAGTLTQGQSYVVRVTAVNSLGETLGSEQTSVVLPPTGNALNLNINPVAGATGYNVYGPATSSSGEQLYNVSPLPPGSINLTSLGSGASPPQLENTTGCAPAGFHNLPTGPSKNYGVTIVLGGKASFCLNDDCQGNGGSTNPPVVMLSPACYGQAGPASPTPASGWVYNLSTDEYSCNAPVSGALQNDGAFPIYGTTSGVIEARHSGGPWEMTGTVYAPNAALSIGPAPPTSCSGAAQPKFGVIPGQFITNSASFCTSNALSPLAWWTNQNGAATPLRVQLIR